MYKVLVIDDEPWILKWFRALPIWEGSGFAIAAESTSPAEGLRLARKHQPHVIFTDIRMAEMTGFEFVRQVHTLLPESRIVFMTACDDFSDAAQALKLHVFDYLLKPVSDERLSLLLQELKRLLDEQHYRESATHRLSCAHALLSAVYAEGGASLEPLSPLLKDRQAVLALIQGDVQEDQLENRLVPLQQEGMTYVFTRAGTRRLLLLLSAPAFDPQTISGVMRSLHIPHCRTGFSQVFHKPETLITPYLEAEGALESAFVIGKEQPVAIFQRNERAFSTLMEELRNIHTAEAFAAFLSQAEARLQAIPANTVQCCKLFGKLLMKLSSLTGTVVEYDWGDRQDFLQAFGSLRGMIDFLQDALKPAEKDNSLNDSVVTEILQDIQSRYMQPLRLSAYAQQYAFNYSYLSTLFKKHTGKSFVNYLVELRLQKAQELIAQTTLPIHEISEMVGYEDYHYFSRLFKKYTGKAPSQYAGKAE